jgi:hypothetical protein
MLSDSFEPADEASSDLLLDQARLKLRAPVSRERAWPALAAAAFFALAGLGFATAAILAPALQTMPAAKTGVR